jgi:hypothetical protein
MGIHASTWLQICVLVLSTNNGLQVLLCCLLMLVLRPNPTLHGLAHVGYAYKGCAVAAALGVLIGRCMLDVLRVSVYYVLHCVPSCHNL